MEKSPLQLMSRMASVVKGTYPKTTQIENVVDLPHHENENKVSVSSEKSILKKRGIEKPASNRYQYSDYVIKIRPNKYHRLPKLLWLIFTFRPIFSSLLNTSIVHPTSTKGTKVFSGPAAVDSVSTDSGISSAFSEEEIDGGNTLSSIASTIDTSSKVTRRYFF